MKNFDSIIREAARELAEFVPADRDEACAERRLTEAMEGADPKEVAYLKSNWKYAIDLVIKKSLKY